MIDWIPVVLVTFKILVLAIGMFFAIKWHYDQGKKGKKAKDKRAILLAGGKVAAIFLLLLVALVIATLLLASKLGLDLTLT